MGGNNTNSNANGNTNGETANANGEANNTGTTGDNGAANNSGTGDQGTRGNANSNQNGTGDNKQGNGEQKKEPSAQELLVEVARLKRANDNLSKENAETKRKLNARMTEQEKLDEEKAQAEADKDARLAELEKNAKIYEYSDMFMDMGYSKEDAKKAATAQAEGDFETLVTIQKNVLQGKIDEVTKQKDEEYKAKEAEWLKNRPDPAQGGGNNDDPFLKGFNADT